MKTISCTKPTCQTLISVNNGQETVNCPNCGNFYFVNEEDLKANPISVESGAPPNMDLYENPPVVEHFVEANIQEKAVQQSPIIPQVQPVGYLVSEEGERFALKEGKNIIGRIEADLVLNDKTVSRRHCVLEIIPRSNQNNWKYVVYDIGLLEGQGSTNGVFLNTRTVRLNNQERVMLEYGMSIELGKTKLTLKRG